MGSLIDATALLRAASFKEDSYVAAALPSSDLRALADLKALLATHPDQISIWGVPLNPPATGADNTPAPADERADVVLLKFLRARDFRVRDAHAMVLRCAAWRAEFRADAVLEEDLGFKDLEGVVAYMHGWDRDGHPVCYNAYGVFRDREMYERAFGDGERLARFLRWRVQVMERGVRALQLRPGGVNAIIQVTDLRDMPKRELRAASNQILSLFQDNYPEMVARKVPQTPLSSPSSASFRHSVERLMVSLMSCVLAGVRERAVVLLGAVLDDLAVPDGAHQEQVRHREGGQRRRDALQVSFVQLLL
jgi:hypothetical protein